MNNQKQKPRLVYSGSITLTDKKDKNGNPAGLAYGHIEIVQNVRSLVIPLDWNPGLYVNKDGSVSLDINVYENTRVNFDQTHHIRPSVNKKAHPDMTPEQIKAATPIIGNLKPFMAQGQSPYSGGQNPYGPQAAPGPYGAQAPYGAQQAAHGPYSQGAPAQQQAGPYGPQQQNPNPYGQFPGAPQQQAPVQQNPNPYGQFPAGGQQRQAPMQGGMLPGMKTAPAQVQQGQQNPNLGAEFDPYAQQGGAGPQEQGPAPEDIPY